MKLFIFIAALVSKSVLGADFGWLPKDHTLSLSGGWEYFDTSSNFDNNSTRADMLVGATPVGLTTHRFWIDAEYGISPEWAVRFLGGLQQSNAYPIAGGNAILSEFSGGDVLVALKYKIRPLSPMITLESFFVAPTYTTSPGTGELMGGQGAVEWGVKSHFGFSKKTLFAAITPGFTFKFGGYAQQLNLEGGIGTTALRPVYALAYFEWKKPLSSELLQDPTLGNHNTAGTAGSYSRLGGSPEMFGVGLKLGVSALDRLAFETRLFYSLAGNRAPDYLMIQFNLRTTLDFTPAAESVRFKDVPFHSENE